ncbi:MAG: DUF1611 domain-containing protein [Candidatus Melainabacteria bacterium]|nr:DUF1611 domain-containing protein [Candidatus Melainabacteria bacterium]
MKIDAKQKLIIYSPGEFGGKKGKTGDGVLKFSPERVLAVVDPLNQGKTVQEMLGYGGSAPIVGSVDEAIALKPGAMLLGCAFTGGRMPKQWRQDIIVALNQKIDVINGLHDFLCDDADFQNAAQKSGAKLIDLRKPPDDLIVGMGRARHSKAHIILTVGTDCNVGKMTSALAVHEKLVKSGKKSAFVATGQTGIIIDGQGVAVDRVIGDFMAGVIEELVLDAAKEAQFVMVEGQGSLAHPGYSGVTLSLLHGAAPDAMILCHQAVRTRIGETEFSIPSLSLMIKTYENMAEFMRPAKVIGISVDTRGLSEQEAKNILEKYENETNLPATDPIRFGVEPLVKAIENHCAKSEQEILCHK